MLPLPCILMASGSVNPIVAIGGWEKTTVGTLSLDTLVWVGWRLCLWPCVSCGPNKRSASRRPVAIATGVSSIGPTTSPTAKTPVADVSDVRSSTRMCPLGR
ncbi:unnamed protein product [Pseudo-nitzschia multistriata]|uniref:Uncharacterized protein n=1 Tax=Pseudo-nitzschia multistriata TaxID=183589 RepID=A0A448Z525_9STRA|nr:unnamed protein product [Pseudo-nitzschia multistriata]